MRRIVGMALSTGLCLLASAGSAQAATALGETFIPATCDVDYTWLQSTSPAPPAAQYAAPSPGVITSWSFQAGPTTGELKFKVGRSVGGGDFTIVGQSELKTPTPSALNTYPERIPVQAGDVIGFYTSPSASTLKCGRNVGTGYATSYLLSDVAPGATANFETLNGFQLDLSAVLEADADADGYGDETQDGCPSDATTQGPCPQPPETEITSGLAKTDKPKVKFRFSSSEPASAFKCKLTGKKVTKNKLKTYNPCASPKIYKRLKPGKYKFFVFATDAASNADPTPAVQKFKVIG